MDVKVVVIGALRFPAENISNVLPYLRSFVQATQDLDGCTMYEVAEDPFDKGVIRFSELWPDRDSLEKHLKAYHVEVWREKARMCGLLERVFWSYDITSEPIAV